MLQPANMKRIYFLTILFFFVICVNAMSLEEAKTLYNKGKYSEAYPTLNEALQNKPKDASLNQWVGVCLFNMGQFDNAIPFLEVANSKKVIESSHYLAKIAIKQYRFDDAENYIDNYIAALTKAKKTIPSHLDSLTSQIVNARNMLERVEHIQIIDSINVDFDDFFKFYKLSNESGSLNSTSILPAQFPSAKHSIVFQPESKSQMVWAMSDSLGYTTLVSSALLSDNVWESPVNLGENLNNGGSANYPYIMPDGITLYYANNGDNSIGGYDILFTRKDEDGFLQPQNIGMPYNSPHNDYMLVIDETTGIGWWASDRNQIEGKVTIYIFIPNETRINYPIDTPNLINLAKINSIKDSWVDSANYSEILNRLNKIMLSAKATSSKAFSLSLPNGKIYTSIDDFSNQSAVDAMQEYLDAVKEYNANINRVSSLRKTYSNGDTSVANEIIELENEILTQQKTLTTLRNTVVSLECQEK